MTRLIDVEEVAKSITSIQQVKRDTSGDVAFSDVASISTNTTTGTVTTKTTNKGPVSFTQVVLKNNGNGTAKILRDGSLLTSTNANVTVTTVNTNLGLTGTHTWTLSAIQTVGTITATATVKKESRQTVNVVGG